METEGLHGVHRRDQVAAALGDIEAVERRAAHRSTYPLWFWILGGAGFAAFPASTSAGGARDVVALAGGAIIVVACLAVTRGRRVRDRCLSLGIRGWGRELAVMVPAIAIIASAVAVSNAFTDWRVAVVTSAASAAAWILAGVVTGRVGTWTR